MNRLNSGLDFVSLLRADFLDLSAIKQDQCCEYINNCKDMIKYVELRENLNKNEDSNYINLAEQIENLCSHRTELAGRTLTCLLRDKYSRIKD